MSITSSAITSSAGDTNGTLLKSSPPAAELASPPPVHNATEQLCRALRLFWERRKFIGWTTGAIAIFAAVISLIVPPRYQSTTRLLPAPTSSPMDLAVQRMRPELGALAGLTGLSDVSNGSERFQALLGSTVIADRLIQRFGLAALYHTRYHEEVRLALAEHTTIQEDRKTGVISVTVEDESPQRAEQMAQAYVQELEKFSAEMNTGAAHMERTFLEERVKQVAGELNDATLRLSQFSTSSGLLDPKDQPIGMIDQAAKLEAAIISLKAELSGQAQIYSPEALKVPQAKLDELQRRLAAIRGKVASAPETGADGVPTLRSLPTLGATFVDLTRTVKLLEGVQMYLSERLELAKVEEVKQLPTFRVMEPADVPEMRVWPKRTRIVLSSFLLGLFLTGLFVYLGAAWAETGSNHPLKALLLDVLPQRERASNQRGSRLA